MEHTAVHADSAPDTAAARPMTGAEESDNFTIRQWQTALVARRHLPSELIYRSLLKWPTEAHALTGIPETLLRAQEAKGDAPRFVRIGRQKFTRQHDLDAWIDRHVDDEEPRDSATAGR